MAVPCSAGAAVVHAVAGSRKVACSERDAECWSGREAPPSQLLLLSGARPLQERVKGLKGGGGPKSAPLGSTGMVACVGLGSLPTAAAQLWAPRGPEHLLCALIEGTGALGATATAVAHPAITGWATGCVVPVSLVAGAAKPGSGAGPSPSQASKSGPASPALLSATLSVVNCCCVTGATQQLASG
jgi:hypothetical protein